MVTGTETVKALVSDSRNSRLEKIPESLEKPQSKDSPKGIRRLLKFGRKNHSSATGEHNIESDNASNNDSEADDCGTNIGSTSEGDMSLLHSLSCILLDHVKLHFDLHLKSTDLSNKSHLHVKFGTVSKFLRT